VKPHPRRFGSPGPLSTAVSSKTAASPDQDAFHRRVLPPPVANRAFAWDAWDLEEPATGIAARVLVAFRHRDPASDALSPLELPPVERVEPGS